MTQRYLLDYGQFFRMDKIELHSAQKKWKTLFGDNSWEMAKKVQLVSDRAHFPTIPKKG